MRRVIIESPFAGDEIANTSYALEAMRDALSRGESPYASHILWAASGALNDGNPEHRRQGIEAGQAWMTVAEAVVVYDDLGITRGMLAGITRAKELGIPVEYRKLWGL